MYPPEKRITDIRNRIDDMIEEAMRVGRTTDPSARSSIRSYINELRSEVWADLDALADESRNGGRTLSERSSKDSKET